MCIYTCKPLLSLSYMYIQRLYKTTLTKPTKPSCNLVHMWVIIFTLTFVRPTQLSATTSWLAPARPRSPPLANNALHSPSIHYACNDISQTVGGLDMLCFCVRPVASCRGMQKSSSRLCMSSSFISLPGAPLVIKRDGNKIVYLESRY